MRHLAYALLLAASVLLWPAHRWVTARPRLVAPIRQCGPPGGRGSRAAATAALLQVLDAVAAQVRGAAAPSVAWDAAVELIGPRAAHLPRAGHEPLADGLRQMAPAEPAVLSVAAAWALAEDVGAPLASVLDQIAVGLRAEADIDAEIEASLAAPRATARLLAGLPIAGVGLGELIGAGPLHVLWGTPVGRLCGVTGVALALAGHLWTQRLVARAAAPA